MGRIWIGTSGWAYKHWAASFYPADCPKTKEFEFYTTQFPTVEVNATFYRLPTENMVNGWRDKAPGDFLFALKGSRFITHLKRLNETGAPLEKYLERIRPLQEHLGPILWQLPPNFHNNNENLRRLGAFLEVLPKQLRHAVEFRHVSWVKTAALTLLSEHNIANVWLSSDRMPMDFTQTADFVYLRFHGLASGAAHDYSEEELKPWADQLRAAAQKETPCFVYFNNDLNTRAPLNAKALMQLVDHWAVEPFNDEPIEPRGRFSKHPAYEGPRSKRLRRESHKNGG